MAEASLLLRIIGDDSSGESALQRIGRSLVAHGRRKATAEADVDTRGGERAVGALNRTLSAFAARVADAKAKVDTAQGHTALNTLTARLAEVSASTAKPDVQVQAAQATLRIERLRAQLVALDRQDVEVDVKVRQGIVDEIAAISTAVKRLGPDLEVGATRAGFFSRALDGLRVSAGGAGDGSTRLGFNLGGLTGRVGPAVVVLSGLAAVIGTSLIAALVAAAASAAAAGAALGAMGLAARAIAVPFQLLSAAVGDRFKATADQAGTAANRLKVALDELKVAARVAARPAVIAVMDALAVSARRVQGILGQLGPAFSRFGEAVANAIGRASREVTSAPFVRFFQATINAARQATGPLTGIFTRLLNIARVVAHAALPLVVEGLRKVYRALLGVDTGAGAVGRMRDRLREMASHIGPVINLAHQLGRILVAIFRAGASEGQSLVVRLGQAAERMADFLNSARGQAEISGFFARMIPLATAVGSAVKGIAGVFLDLARIAAPAVQALVGNLVNLGRSVGQTLGPSFQQLGVLAGRFIEALRPALPFVQNILLPIVKGAFEGILFVLRPLVEVVGFFARALGAIGTAAAPLRPVLEAIGNVLGFIGGIIAGAIILPFRAAVAVFGVASRVASRMGGVFSEVGAIVGRVGAFVGRVFSAMGRTVASVFNAIRSVTASVWGAVRSVITTAATGARNVVVAVFSALRSAVTSIFGAIRSVASSVWNAIRTVVVGAATTARNLAVGAFNALRSAVTTIFNAIRSVASAVWNSVRSVVVSAAAGIRNFVVAAFNSLRAGVTAAFNAVRSVAASVWNAVRNTIVNAIRSAVSFVAGAAGAFFNAGVNMIRGLINGIVAMARHVFQVVQNVIGGAVRYARQLLGIGSPSKVFASFGRDVGRGFIAGVEGMSGQVNRALQSSLTGPLAGLGSQLNAAVAGSVGVNVGGLRGVSKQETQGPAQIHRHYHVQTIGGGSPDPEFLIAQLDQRLREGY